MEDRSQIYIKYDNDKLLAIQEKYALGYDFIGSAVYCAETVISLLKDNEELILIGENLLDRFFFFVHDSEADLQNYQKLFNYCNQCGIIILLNGYVTMRYINRNYFSRLRHLSESIEEYTRIKDDDIAGRIRSEFRGNDEIAILSQQTASMISELQKHIDRIMTISGELMTANERAEKFSELARKDAMTGLYNKMSYYEAVSRLDESIEKGCAKFAIIVIDLNYLKRINDEYGHNHGDIMIKKLADIIDSFFDPATSYRIGGDEFAVILEGESSRNALTLTANFRNLIMSESALGYWIYPSAAAGCSVYRAGTDKCVRDVFDRADTEMYGNKIQMKARRKN